MGEQEQRQEQEMENKSAIPGAASEPEIKDAEETKAEETKEVEQPIAEAAKEDVDTGATATTGDIPVADAHPTVEPDGASSAA